MRAFIGLTLVQLAADLARPAMADFGLVPLSSLGLEALWPRASCMPRKGTENSPILDRWRRCLGSRGRWRERWRNLRMGGATAREIALAGAPGADLAGLLARYEAGASTAIAGRSGARLRARRAVYIRRSSTAYGLDCPCCCWMLRLNPPLIWICLSAWPNARRRCSRRSVPESMSWSAAGEWARKSGPSAKRFLPGTFTHVFVFRGAFCARSATARSKCSRLPAKGWKRWKSRAAF